MRAGTSLNSFSQKPTSPSRIFMDIVETDSSALCPAASHLPCRKFKFPDEKGSISAQNFAFTQPCILSSFTPRWHFKNADEKLRRFRTPTKRLFQSLIKKNKFSLTFVRDFCEVRRLQMLPSENHPWLPCSSFSHNIEAQIVALSRSAKLYYSTECREIQFNFPISTLYQRVNDAYK